MYVCLLYVCVCVCMCVYVWMCVCVYVCVCMYTAGPYVELLLRHGANAAVKSDDDTTPLHMYVCMYM